MWYEENLNSWEALEQELEKLRAANSGRYQHGPLSKQEFLFRGHGSSRWSLTTTLERQWSDPRVVKYFEMVGGIRPQIESFTGRSWNVPPRPEIARWLSQVSGHPLFFNIPGYDYLIHLRHHGFPSPLLDWTASPYVAAFFAFSRTTDTRVAIFAFLDDTGHGKMSSAHEPGIITTGPYVRTHARHFLQQSRYSICIQRKDDDGAWMFRSHEDVFRRSDSGREQDLLWKFTLPASERHKVLRKLDDFNLNAYSLFQSEEALMETLATREIDFRTHERS